MLNHHARRFAREKAVLRCAAMRLGQAKPIFTWGLVAALLALLPLLAVLQYRWLGKVSEGERERMKNNLNASARQFCQDFDAEVTAAFLYFQATPEDPAELKNEAFAERYEHWMSTGTHPQLVKEVYQTQTQSDGSIGLTRFNSQTRSFEDSSWPESLAKMRRAMNAQQARRESLRLMLHDVLKRRDGKPLDSNQGTMVVHISLGPVDEDLPGLVISIPEFNKDSAVPLPVARAYRIIALDADYLRRVLIPELAARHFGAAPVSEYNLAVVKRSDPAHPFFQSDDHLPATLFNEGDVAADFFKIRLNETNRLFLAQTRSTKTKDEPATSGKNNTPGFSVFESRQQQVAISLSSEIKLGGEPVSGSKADDALQSMLKRKDEGQWNLVVKHRSGSLEAAVASVRRRNLAISFGVLLLLGISVGLIVQSSRRAQKLATQQMEFVAGVSHELRTPLAVICSAAENLADGVIDNRDQIKRYGGLIRDEGRRLTGMVEQVLEFAGAQSGRQTYDLRPAMVSRVIEDALAASHLQLSEGGFALDLHQSEELPLINADVSALSRAIQNLLSNAMKYSGESRWIGLRVDAVKNAGRDEVRIAVTDRGLGIAPQELPHIFEPFYRGKEVSAAQIRGNGLGLSLVKHIVDAHGGRVVVESNVGQGSNFSVFLPAVSAAQVASEVPSENYEQAHLAG